MLKQKYRIITHTPNKQKAQKAFHKQHLKQMLHMEES